MAHEKAHQTPVYWLEVQGTTIHISLWREYFDWLHLCMTEITNNSGLRLEYVSSIREIWGRLLLALV